MTSNNKPFAMFFNASPRKGWNTAKMLEAAKAGAEEAGAETELVNLYDISFPGCKSCFACKLKNAKTNGVCAIRDNLRPVLERARKADVLVLGSPIYFSYPTGVYRAFLERLAFPVYSYHYEDGKPLVCRDKVIETANIFTMNCPEGMMKDIGYPTLLESNTQTLLAVFQPLRGLALKNMANGLLFVISQASIRSRCGRSYCASCRHRCRCSRP